MRTSPVVHVRPVPHYLMVGEKPFSDPRTPRTHTITPPRDTTPPTTGGHRNSRPTTPVGRELPPGDRTSYTNGTDDLARDTCPSKVLPPANDSVATTSTTRILPRGDVPHSHNGTLDVGHSPQVALTPSRSGVFIQTISTPHDSGTKGPLTDFPPGLL